MLVTRASPAPTGEALLWFATSLITLPGRLRAGPRGLPAVEGRSSPKIVKQPIDQHHGDVVGRVRRLLTRSIQRDAHLEPKTLVHEVNEIGAVVGVPVVAVSVSSRLY